MLVTKAAFEKRNMAMMVISPVCPDPPRPQNKAMGRLGCCLPSGHIVRLYSMPLLAEMPDQGKRLQRMFWAWR